MKKIIILILLISSSQLFAQNITTRFEQSGGTQTPTYFEIIHWWKNLSLHSNLVKISAIGSTDAGFPLHLVLISNDKNLSLSTIHKTNKRIILFNNGIHPGEPDGIDASMLLARDIVLKKYRLPDNVILAIIPVYNIGGCLNRSKNFRVDQNGPEEFGSRGNAQNLDLNRDFIKCDSKNARAFAQIFHLLDPDVFVDNHVSDGADYQHIMTLIASQHDKLGGAMGEFMHHNFEPALYKLMKEKSYDLVPYVEVFNETPDKGWSEFWDAPRYSNGYAALFNCFAFTPETHMLKPYAQRVKATLALEQCFIEFTAANNNEIKLLREQAKQNVKTENEFPIGWKQDSTKFTNIDFKGYKGLYKTSKVSGLPRLYYDRNQPFEKQIPYYNFYYPVLNIKKPKAYIIPQGWWKVIELLQLNNVKMLRLKNDTTIEQIENYTIADYKSSNRPYEAHHPNSNVKIATTVHPVTFRKGDYYIEMNQEANRFITEVLEPQAEDSYFVWNFFDAILIQKEGFSPYSFEDIAARYLQEHPLIKSKLEERKKTDTAFAKSAFAQLDFVFKNSPWYEPAHMQYPVYRVLQ
jgi:Predicted carboxypeptidase